MLLGDEIRLVPNSDGGRDAKLVGRLQATNLRDRWSRRNDEGDIAKRVAERAEIPDGQALELLEWILDLLKSTLREGEDITIVGLGRFRVRSKNARIGRNPRTD